MMSSSQPAPCSGRLLRFPCWSWDLFMPIEPMMAAVPGPSRLAGEPPAVLQSHCPSHEHDGAVGL
jgi:hypothetical protein